MFAAAQAIDNVFTQPWSSPSACLPTRSEIFIVVSVAGSLAGHGHGVSHPGYTLIRIVAREFWRRSLGSGPDPAHGIPGQG